MINKQKEQSRRQGNIYLKAFAMAAAGWLTAQLPLLIRSGGIYVGFGDYYAQIFMFWQHIHKMLLSGIPMWDWTSDLGMNFIGGYSFYGLFSPYTLLSLLFPEKALPWGITVINALKYGVAAVGAALYSRQYVKKDNSALICGLLYAFSGIMLFNQVYHFSDVISLFPFVLYFFDKLITEKKPLAFAIMLAVSGITNYYFFWGECVFILMYYIVRVWRNDVSFEIKHFIRIGFEAITGIALTGFVLLPSFIYLQGNERASESIFDVNLLSYEAAGTVLKIIQSALMIPDESTGGFLFREYQLDGASVSLYIPLFTVIGAAAYISRNKKSWQTALLGVCGVFAAFPLLNSFFSAFNSRYYARWFYMPLLVMITVTGIYIDDFDNTDIKREIKLTAIISSVFGAYGLFTIARSGEVDFYNCFQLVFMALCLLLMYNMRYGESKSAFSAKNITKIAYVMSVIPFLFFSFRVSTENNGYYVKDYISCLFNDFQPVEIEEDNNFRITSRPATYFNAGFNFGYPTVSFFHSLIPESTSDFYAAVGKYRASNGTYDPHEYAIFSFLSVKYEVMFSGVLAGGVYVEPEHIITEREGFSLSDSQNRYVMFENENYIPMGFTYDNYININRINGAKSSGGYDNKSTDNDKYYTDINDTAAEQGYSIAEKEQLLLKGIWLTDEQAAMYSDILEELPEDKMNDLTVSAYRRDCSERRASAAYMFEPQKDGFVSRINNKKDNLVFYSVPYDEGFTAYVDGNEAKIERVFGGLCAVRVPEGDHEVRFVYEVRGLKTGIAISLCGLAMAAVYGIASAMKRKTAK